MENEVQIDSLPVAAESHGSPGTSTPKSPKRKTPAPRKPRPTTADKVVAEATERINEALNAAVDEAKVALLTEVSSEAKTRLDRILQYADGAREEVTRRLRTMQADFETALTKAVDKFNETVGVKLRELEATHNKYKGHFEAAATQATQLQTTLAEYKRQNAELLEVAKKLREEFEAYKPTIAATREDAIAVKNLTVNFKADLLSLKEGLADVRRSAGRYC